MDGPHIKLDFAVVAGPHGIIKKLKQQINCTLNYDDLTYELSTLSTG